MQISPLNTYQPTQNVQPPAPEQDKTRETFQEFVGQVLFGQMLSAMRSTTKEVPYFHGGRAEEVFRNQLDQEWAKELTKTSAERFSDPMFELMMMQNRR
jgi:flagellar protein FlgJ